jgi:hypothetical protein
MLEYRQHQQMVEPDVDEIGPVDRSDRLRSEGVRRRGDLEVPRQSTRLRRLPPVHVVVGRDHAEDPLGAVAEVEDERDVERDEIAEPRRIEAPWRVREADAHDRSGHVRPPRVDGPVGEREVRG